MIPRDRDDPWDDEEGDIDALNLTRLDPDDDEDEDTDFDDDDSEDDDLDLDVFDEAFQDHEDDDL